MAAFFLVRDAAQECLLQTAERVFEERGFRGGRRYALSSGVLLLYPKQLLAVENCCENGRGRLFCIGTLAYKGKSCQESLRALLEDYLSGGIDEDALRGAFVLLLEAGGELSILTDRAGLYKLFTDEQQSFLSSSFLAAAACTAHTLDEDSVIEQVLYGYVAAPHTLVKEVRSLTKDDPQRPGWLRWLGGAAPEAAAAAKDEAEDAARQAGEIDSYLQDVRALAEEFGCECGLSGGCDSRLIYTAVNERCCRMRSAHSHSTSKIHDKEVSVVRKLTELYDTPLRIVPTTALLELPPEEIDRTLRENVLYFDARNAEAIGAASQTHTREYKAATSNGAGLTFSGIGGEIYRDFYYTGKRRLPVSKWLESRVFLPCTRLTVPQADYERCLRRITDKLCKRLGLQSDRVSGKRLAKRYFDSYRIPNSLVNVIHANNQMSFYLAPFTDAALMQSACSGARWQDHCGSYEGKIIAAFNENAAKIPTSKGYPIYPLPAKNRLKWELRERYPAKVWTARNNRAVADPKRAERLRTALESTEYLAEAFRRFRQRFPDWEYSYFLEGMMPYNAMLFAICAVYEVLHLTDGSAAQI